MAIRPIFIPNQVGSLLVSSVDIEFNWVAGLAPSQKQKNIRSLHAAAAGKRNLGKILEISTKSEQETGVALSAFNLSLTLANGQAHCVETIFQSSKVFEKGGPYLDLLDMPAAAAKTDQRLKQSGALVGFSLDGMSWPLAPKTVFYDWLYLNALRQHPKLSAQLTVFDGFSDIEFNPARSLNCQAASAALFSALAGRNELSTALVSAEALLARMVLVAPPTSQC